MWVVLIFEGLGMCRDALRVVCAIFGGLLIYCDVIYVHSFIVWHTVLFVYENRCAREYLEDLCFLVLRMKCMNEVWQNTNVMDCE